MTSKQSTGLVAFLWALAVALTDDSLRTSLLSVIPSEYVPLLTAVLGLLATVVNRYVAHRNPDGGPVAAPYSPIEQQTKPRFRTDRHNNPLAVTVDVAKQAGLVEGVDYLKGDPFKGSDGRIYYTARLLGDPIVQSIRIIDNIGFYTASGKQRWTHTAMKEQDWKALTFAQKVDVIRTMYIREGGTELLGLFDKYAA